MAIWDTLGGWRKSLVFISRGLYTCLLALLYLLISKALCSGHHSTSRTMPSPCLQELSRKECTESFQVSTVEEKTSVTPETTLAGFNDHFKAYNHPHLSCEQSSAANTQEGVHSMVIPKIVVQDFSEDGLIRCKTLERSSTGLGTPERRRRLSWVYMTTKDHHTVITQVPPSRSPTLGGLGRGRYLTDNLTLNRRLSDALAQDTLRFSTGRKRTTGDIATEDGSFVIVGL